MGIADHAKKAENSSILGEKQLLKLWLKEFEVEMTIVEWFKGRTE